jgi:hypothetical protein
MSDSPESVREYIRAHVTIPEAFRLIPNQTMPQTIDRPTVVVKHLRMEPLAEAPVGHVRNTVILTLADHHETEAIAEEALDTAVVELLTALDGHEAITWTEAEKVSVVDRYLGWDITLTVITSRKETA